jgi:hemoglobin
MKHRIALLGAVAVVVMLSACGNMEMKKPASLYDRLGGKPAITAVVDDFVGNVAGDSRINHRFANANIPHLKQMLVDQVCAATGGPCTYAGRDMVTAHKGMSISDAEFGALVGDLVTSLDKFKVPEKEKGELLAALGGMKGDIVGR